MPYYHPTKPAARAAAMQYEEMFDVQTVMEPYNGWVIKLIPKSAEVLKYPLYDLLQHVELDMGSMGLVRNRPADRVRPPPLVRETPRRAPAKPAAPPPPPPPAPGGQPPAPPRSAAPPPPPPPPSPQGVQTGTNRI